MSKKIPNNQSRVLDLLFIRPVLNGVIIFVLLLLLSSYVMYQRHELLANEEKQVSLDVLRSTKKGFQHILNQSQTATTAISLIVDPEGKVRNFESTAASIIETSDFIEVLELLPGGVIEYVYPLPGNEPVLHYNILEDSARNREAFRAKENGQLYFAGPLELRQGGKAVVGRLPIFRKNRFWGFSAAIIRFNSLLRAVGIDTTGKDGYYYQFSKRNLETKKEEYFLPPNEAFSHSKKVVSDIIPEGDWIISVVPIDTGKVLRGMAPFIIISLLLSVTGGVLMAQVTRKPFKLQKIVTERTEELNRSEQRNKAIVEAIPDLIFITDREGRILDYSNPHNELLFLPPAEFLGKRISEILPPDVSGEITGKISKASVSREIYSLSYSLEMGNETRHYEARFVASAVNEVYVIVRDITENKKVQDALQESEKKLREVFNSSFQFTGLLDTEGRLMEVNQTALNYSGFKEKDLHGRYFWDIDFWNNEEQRQKRVEWLKQAIREVAEGRTVRQEIEVILKDDLVDTFDFSIKPVKNAEGKIIYLITEGRLITELSQAEAKLKLAHQQLKMHLSNSPLGVVEYNHELVVTQWSKKSEEIFGWTEDEVLNNNITAFNLIYEEDIGKTTIVAEELMRGHVNGNISYNRNYTKKGEVVHCVWYNSVIKDDKGKVVTVMSLVQDVTKERETEEALRKSELKLRQVLSSTTDNFYVVDNNYTIILINETAERNLKKDWGRDVKTGVRLNDVIPGNIDEPILESLEKVFWGIPVEYELEIKKEGLPEWVQVSYSPVKERSGNVTAATILAKDISEKKRAEQLVKESEEKYRSFFEKASDAIFVFNRQGRFMDVNSVSTDLLGYTKEELVTMSLTDIVFTDDLKNNPIRLDLLANGTPVIRKREFKRKDGTGVFVEVNSTRLPDGNFMGLVRDLTDRITAQRQLETEKELSDSIINSLPGVFYFYDHTGKFLRWNTRFEDVTGYSAEEISNMHPLDFFEGRDREIIQERIGEVFSKGISDAEALFKTKSGEKIPYYFTGASIMNGDELCLLGMGVDITERKKAESALRESETKYRLLFTNTPLPMWVYDENTLEFLDVNEAAIFHYGYSKRKFLSMCLTDLYPHDNKNFGIKPNKPGGQSRHIKEDGRIIDVEISSHDILFNSREARLMVAVDITDELRYKKEIRKTTEQLRQLTHHLQNIREEERKHIAREIHDELGQQLTVLKMDISWLDKKIKTDDSVIMSRLKNLLVMIDNTVKSVRKISSELRPSMLDDIGLIAAMEWHAQEFEKRFGIKTIFSTELQEVVLPAHLSNGIFRIYQESLTNIARHSDATEVTATVKQKDGYITINIYDNGKGFMPSSIENKKTLGILGMRERASMLEAEFSIESAPGKGTNVEVKVPVSN